MCKFLAAPVEFYGDEKGWVKSMKCIAMELTEPDARGRRGVKPSLAANSRWTWTQSSSLSVKRLTP
jgi:glutamate synthase (NADPH/NADH) small chain